MDTAISILKENLPQLIEMVRSEAKLPSEVEEKIESLAEELPYMNAFVQSARAKQKADKTVNLVVQAITKVAQQAENVIDTYFYNLIRHNRKPYLFRLFSTVNYQQDLHDVNDSIESIKKRIQEIYANKDRYGIEEGVFAEEDTGAAAMLESTRRKVEEDDVIGFDKYSEEVITMLKEGSTSSRAVITIYGMGGLGKTTLARKIFKELQGASHFDMVIWAYLSKEIRPEEVLLEILGTTTAASSGSLSLPYLKKKLKEDILKDKRYLIIFDDLWETKLWAEIEDSFPKQEIGSKILITSRDKDVATRANPSLNGTILDYYALQPLNDADSRKLFCKKAFGKEICDDGSLEPYVEKIVKKCKGLPLAIVVSAGLLVKKSIQQWQVITEKINYYINENSQADDILRLSYDSLPEKLKPCFLYFGLYPSDSKVPVKQLIQLWIAEGFIQVEQTSADVPEPEQIAEDYLQQLIDRSLIQVTSRRSDGGPKTCGIHDLLRDLCIFKSREENFLEIYRDGYNKIKIKPRRLSLHCSTISYRSDPYDNSSTRSLFCFTRSSSTDSKWFLKEFKLLRVLHLGYEKLNIFDDDVLQNFIFLKYLRAETQQQKGITAKSIGDLRNLETLDARGWRVTLPTGIWKLKRLRHVYLDRAVLPERSENETLVNLQTLSIIDLEGGNISLLKNGAFPKLRKLGIHCSNPIGSEASELLLGLECLETLKIISPLLPPNASFPPSITKITLKNLNTASFQNYMDTLAKLPSLIILKTFKIGPSFRGSDISLSFAEGAFPLLQVFVIEESCHQKLTLKEGACPQLRRLIVNKCNKLKGLPNELWSLKNLVEVKISHYSEEMADELRKLEDKDRIKLMAYPPLDEELNPFDD